MSDVDRGVYQALDLRVAQHPSESSRRVLLKTLAYALSLDEGIAFSRGGLSDTDEPEIAIRDATGLTITLWVEIGSPAADRLKRATNTAPSVAVFCAGDAEGVIERAAALSRKDRVVVHAIDPAFVDALAESVAAAGGRFALVRSGGHLYATSDGNTLDSPLVTTALGVA